MSEISEPVASQTTSSPGAAIAGLPRTFDSRWFYTTDDENVHGPVSAETLRELHACGILGDSTQIAAEGSNTWLPIKGGLPVAPLRLRVQTSRPDQAGSTTWSGMMGGVTKISGLEGLEDQSFKNLFRGMLRKGSLQEIEELFATGTPTTTPSPEQVGTGWPSPWIFLRLLTLSLLAAGGFFWAWMRFDNPRLYPGWLMAGAIAVPFSVLIFFFEANVARNVSLTRVILLFVGGGLISMIASLFLFEATGLHTWLGTMAAGPIEELGKVLALVFFAHHWKHLHWS